MGKFTVDLTRLVNKTKGRIDFVVQKATYEIFSSVIMKSPVDTGRFRGNWVASAGSYGSVSVDSIDLRGSNTINNMANVALKTKSGGIVYMVNNLPYAQRLEYGYSAQAPAGVVRTTILEFQQFINSAVNSSK